jgi:hypothetical protein
MEAEETTVLKNPTVIKMERHNTFSSNANTSTRGSFGDDDLFNETNEIEIEDTRYKQGKHTTHKFQKPDSHGKMRADSASKDKFYDSPEKFVETKKESFSKSKKG